MKIDEFILTILLCGVFFSGLIQIIFWITPEIQTFNIKNWECVEYSKWQPSFTDKDEQHRDCLQYKKKDFNKEPK